MQDTPKNSSIYHSDLSQTPLTNVVMPMLTVASGVSQKRAPAKKRRPQQRTKKPVVAKASENGADTPAVSLGQQAPVRLTLRSYSGEDDTLIMRLTQEGISPIYRASYGTELNMNSVMEYIQASYTRIVVVEDEPAGYVSVMADDSGRLNVGTLVIAAPHQGKGYGKRIMHQLEHEAQALGMVEMETYIQATNERGRSLAKSLGYTEVQANQSQTIVMRKTLTPLSGPTINTQVVPPVM